MSMREAKADAAFEYPMPIVGIVPPIPTATAAKAAGRDRVAVHAPSSGPSGNGTSERTDALASREASADAHALSEQDQRQAAQVALCTIGKLALPDAILSKLGPLSDDEIMLMRRHPENGERIVGAIPELAHLAPDIRAEHERWDGTGYPDGLTGDEIPIASQIVFVCDAMTSDRPYRRRMPRDAAIAELATGAASQFNGDCVQALFAVLARG